MPKLWTETIATHRREVGDAILDTTVALVAEHGLRGVTMSKIADETGIGRATLYKYFPDVEAILRAWHARHVEAHLAELAKIRAKSEQSKRVRAVLEAYASIRHHHADSEIGPLLHGGEHADTNDQRLHDFLSELLAEHAKLGEVRDDVAPTELATYCVHALAAAANLRSKAAVRRLVDVTLDGLRGVAADERKTPTRR